MILDAERVTFRYPGAARPALAGASFRVGPGEFVAIAGPNGSGKTSLLRALLGLARPEAGTVRLDGRPIADWPRAEFAERVGALPQREAPVFPTTVRETVLLGRWARLGPVAPVGPDDEAAVASALARCDVTGLGERSIETLSGGEWQRVRLARALVASPRLLLLDEPTAALDVGHAMELFELLRGLVADGLGVVVITHELSLAARYADRVVLLDHGAVVADGPVDAVLREELISRVFGWPIAIARLADGTPSLVPLRRPSTGGGSAPPLQGSSA